MSQDDLDKLDHLRGVVAHHMHVEEPNRFPALVRHGQAAERLRLAARYDEAFARYMGVDADLS